MTGRGIAFDFARDLRKPEVRERLALLGFDGDAGDVILPWFDDETHAEASRRIPADCRRALLVAPDADLPSGWTMQWAKPQPWPPNNSRRPCRWRVDFGRLKQRRQEEDLMCDEKLLRLSEQDRHRLWRHYGRLAPGQPAAWQRSRRGAGPSSDGRMV